MRKSPLNVLQRRHAALRDFLTLIREPRRQQAVGAGGSLVRRAQREDGWPCGLGAPELELPVVHVGVGGDLVSEHGLGVRVFAAGVAGGRARAHELALLAGLSVAFAEFLVGVLAWGLAWEVGGCGDVSTSF